MLSDLTSKISDQVNGRLRQKMQEMSRRERYFVMAAGVAIVLFIFFQFIISPVTTWGKRLDQNLTVEKTELQEMLALQQEHKGLTHLASSAAHGLNNRDKNFTLFSFLDDLAGRAGVKNNITYMKPSTSDKENGGYPLSIVEVKLEMVNLKGLTSYLYMIETSGEKIFVKRVSISKNEGNKTGVDVVMRVETIKS